MSEQKKRWYHDDIAWKHDKVLQVSAGTVGIYAMAGAVAGLIVMLVLGVSGDLRSQDERFTCAALQLDSRRYAFTDSVVCVPYPTRRDTTTLEVPRGE
jgi:hypothetical protein